MKTLSGTFAFIALAVVAVLTFRAFAQSPEPGANKKFVLKIGRTTEDYVDLRDKTTFDTALTTLGDHGGQYHIRFLAKEGATPIDPYHPGDHASIKTDKVTMSELAKNASAGESAVNDPNVTVRISSNEATDIKAVLDTFK
jgi:hypothetical protein